MRDQSLKEQRKAMKRAYRQERRSKRKRSGSVLAGLLLMCVGTLLLLRAFGTPFPEWLFTWPMIVIAFGLLAGAGNSFRDPGWVIISGVGTVFLLQEIWPHTSIYMFIWPIFIIALGFIIMLAPRRHRRWHEKWDKFREMQGQNKEYWKNWERGDYYQGWQNPQQTDPNTATQTSPNPDATENTGSEQNRKADNWLDAVTIFGNIKKMVYSKNFKGGDVVSIFGGAEINLTQADFNGTIVIEMVQIFSGAKLIVPPHWQIRSEMVAIFGGIEDKRPAQTSYDENKVVVLNGTTFFGGLEIKSY
jgi:predicted membrane protein